MSDDDFTEIGLTRVTKRAQQRAEILARASGEGTDIGTAEVIEHDTLDDVTRLGARGARTGKTLALGLISVAPGESIAETARRRFTIEIAGRHYAAQALSRPPFDPTGERMKA